jgi:hypothetical protein
MTGGVTVTYIKLSLLAAVVIVLSFGTSFGLSFSVIKNGAGPADSIRTNESFTIEFYTGFTEGDENRFAWSSPFRFYGTDDVTTLSSAGTFVNNPDFDDLWDFVFNPNNYFGAFESWDGDLTNNAGGLTGDQFNYSAIEMFPQLPSSGSIKVFEVQFDGIIGDSTTSGDFCVDSGDFVNNTYDWLFDPPSPSFGPVCWPVVDGYFLLYIGDKEIYENEELLFTVQCRDVGGYTPEIYTSSLPFGADFVDSGNGLGYFSWTPNFWQSGEYSVAFYAYTPFDTAYENITITVLNNDRAPILDSVGSKEVSEQEALAFTVTASDPDSTLLESLEFTTENLPEGAIFTDYGDGTSFFYWTPNYAQVGTYYVTFIVSDGELSDSETVEIVVDDVPIGPVIYVSTTGNDVYGDGGIMHPFRTIQFAVNASNDGDSVILMPGTYTGDNNRDITISKDIVLRSEQGAEVTILDCQGSEEDPHRGFINIKKIDGLTIRSGYAKGMEIWDDIGGAIAQLYDSNVVENCIFENNFANLGGGAIVCWGYSDILIENCTFINNLTNGYGGGIYIDSARDTVRNCIFIGNSAWGGAGMGVYDSDASYLMAQNCTFYGNHGAGITIEDYLPKYQFDTTVIKEKDPYEIILFNCIFAFNQGAGIQNRFYSPPIVITCCNSYGNLANDLELLINDDTTNCISRNPRFCDTANKDLHLAANSLCLPENNICGVLIGALGAGCDPVFCGDVNGDEEVNIFDVTYLITYLYIEGPAPVNLSLADVNSDSAVNIFDITFLITYLYIEGPSPDCP